MKRAFMLIAVIMFLAACSSNNLVKVDRPSGDFTYSGKITPGKWLKNIQVPYEYKQKSYTAKMQMYFPKSYKQGDSLRTIIALHGYSENHTIWQYKTSISSLADKYNFIIVCPYMGKTVYEMKFFPETKRKWAEIPGGLFVGKILINYLQKTFDIATDNKKTAMLGVKNGALGAFLTAARFSGDIGAVAGFSGIYDKNSLLNSRKFINMYGSYNKHNKRWKTSDNLLKMASHLQKTPVYIWHGGRDQSVPPEQSLIMTIKLKKYKNVTYNQREKVLSGWGDFKRYAVPEAMEFFNKKLVP